ncbi:MAG: helix-turn-helix transcriptional regulator [Streptomyces sp.]|nr:helix-turn-helix transcriptional regulator [Streptomyces sp.]
MPDLPTPDQLRTYLRNTGWAEQPPGVAGHMWTRDDRTIGFVLEPDADDIDGIITRIALAEKRLFDEVRESALSADSPEPDLLASLPARIRAELTRRRMTQRDFAREVAASPSTITRLMAKRQMCDAATLVRICGWLRADPADFADERVNEAYRRGRADQAAEVAAVLEGGGDA